MVFTRISVKNLELSEDLINYKRNEFIAKFSAIHGDSHEERWIWQEKLTKCLCNAVTISICNFPSTLVPKRLSTA
ncbi:unnamed protein product [Caenorhabditis nigoni]